jgi:ABC-type phosphate/phosphonate transport system substrate-binding protein
METPILIGAVAYDPRVVPIWEGMRDYFREAGPPSDYILFSNYDRQVQALLDRTIDIAWNTNLAWIKVHLRTKGDCRALAMRDVDERFTTVFVARADSGIGALADLRGKRLALGSADSGQAAILPIHYLQQIGIDPARECRLLRFDIDVGKHGDTGTSELEVLQALIERRADAGALAESTWDKQLAKRRADLNKIQRIWTSPGYCHCNFTALADFPEDRGRRWTDSLLQMNYDNPRWRELMDLEGLKRWTRPDAEVLKGYEILFDAVKRQNLAEVWDTKEENKR